MTSLPVYIDFKSPAAWLAFGPLTALADQQALRIHWRPLKTRLEPLLERPPSEGTGERHRRVRAIARRRIHLKYAAIQAIPMHFPDTPCATDLALASLLLIPQYNNHYIQRLFLAFWAQQADLNEAATINACLADAGLPPAHLDQAQARQALETHQQQAQADGIIDAPAILIDDQIFIGREHLPWIRSLLGARGC